MSLPERLEPHIPHGVSMHPDARRLAEKTILRMFSADELRRIVRYLPDGQRLSAHLPGRGSAPIDLVHSTIDLMESHGVWSALITEMRRERPRRIAEVEALARALQPPIAAPTPPPSPTAPPTVPAGGYDLFLGHSSPDKPVARAIYKSLKDCGLSVFFDEESIPLGARWPTEIRVALKSARVVLMLYAENTPVGFYVEEELTTVVARVRASNRHQRLVPVYIDGLPGPEADVPYGLRTFHGLSLPGVGAAGVAERVRRELGDMDA